MCGAKPLGSIMHTPLHVRERKFWISGTAQWPLCCHFRQFGRLPKIKAKSRFFKYCQIFGLGAEICFTLVLISQTSGSSKFVCNPFILYRRFLQYTRLSQIMTKPGFFASLPKFFRAFGAVCHCFVVSGRFCARGRKTFSQRLSATISKTNDCFYQSNFLVLGKGAFCSHKLSKGALLGKSLRNTGLTL